MAVDEFVPTHAANDHQLAEGVVQMIVAAKDMRDAHVVVVDDNGQHVGRRAVERRMTKSSISSFTTVTSP